MKNPLEQFNIVEFIPLSVAGINIAFTNASLMLILTVAAIASYILLGTNKRSMIPGYWQSSVEMLYIMVESMLEEAVGQDYRKYVPFVFSIFIFILICNLLGMIPHSFSATSHIAITLTLAAITFIIINLVGFWKHGWHYLSLFLPAGIPMIMAPLMIFIELCAYLARPFSLSLRLAANMIAGHIMMKILAGFIVMSGATSVLLGVAPLTLLTIITGFEIFIALLQAYIFTILTCVYLNDAVNLH